MAAPPAPAEQPVPIASASVLLLREAPELQVLMMVRGAGGPFPSAMVFPGGKLDPADLAPAWLDVADGAEGFDAEQRGLRVAAWRELFEEAGIAPCPLPSAAPEGAAFLDRLRHAEARLDLAALRPFARWITPPSERHRFDTRFFLGALAGVEPVCDGREAVSAEWIAPADALALGASGGRRMLFPTRALLRRLAEAGTVERCFAAARDTAWTPIQPRIEERGGTRYVTIPADLGYSVYEEPF